MLENKFILLPLLTAIAALPVVVWVILFFKASKQSKKILGLVFFLGILAAPAMLGIQYLWDLDPQFNLELLIQNSISDIRVQSMMIFILFGMMEEVLKHFAVRSIDKHTVAVKTVNNAIRLSILSALGFAFAENIFYMYMLWPSLTVGGLVGLFVARSGITMLGHMIFSGIFGYYFGVSKFAIDITKQKEMVNENSWTTKVLAKVFNKPMPEAFREKTILKGLLLAMGFHAVFNFLLEIQMVIPVVIFVALGFFFLKHLLKRKVGHLVLFTDISTQKKSLMGKKDEEVILELLSMWFKDGRYVDVMHICERLLERDPDNNVVKIFKARALDKIDNSSVYKKILQTIFKSKEQLNHDDKNIISKHLEVKKS